MAIIFMTGQRQMAISGKWRSREDESIDSLSAAHDNRDNRELYKKWQKAVR